MVKHGPPPANVSKMLPILSEGAREEVIKRAVERYLPEVSIRRGRSSSRERFFLSERTAY